MTTPFDHPFRVMTEREVPISTSEVGTLRLRAEGAIIKITGLEEPRSASRAGPSRRLSTRRRDTRLVAGVGAAVAVLVLTACSSIPIWREPCD